MTIDQHLKKHSPKINLFDLELILAHTLKKPREFILAHPDKTITKRQELKIKKFTKRRQNHEPLAYILGEKGFYGLDFRVNKYTLIPRPETELLVEKTLKLDSKNKTIIDVGTGSGNIIISLAKNLCRHCHSRGSGNDIKFFGIDISKKALSVAKYNAKKNKVAKKINFIQSNLLNYFLKNNWQNKKFNNLVIAANLPYLSQKIYSAAMPDVKNFEPKSALLSCNSGLYHYEKLLRQIKKIKETYFLFSVSCFFEISPEQKSQLQKIIEQIFPESIVKFHKDLARKWRVAEIKI